MSFSHTFLLLQKEGFLVRSCLTIGLTELRNSNLSDLGKFYSAFFQLSIGIERMMKIILILDHMVNNHLAAPSQQKIKNYGHDLVILFESINALAKKLGLQYFDSLDKLGMEYKILEFLGKFAKSSRYYNIDTLSGVGAANDPLSEWNTIILEIINRDVSPRQKQRISREATVMASFLQDYARIISHNLDNHLLTLDQTLSVPRFQDLAASHTVYYVFRLLSPLNRTLSDITHRASELNLKEQPEICHIPHMSEFFIFLWLDDKAQILRKKKWP